LKILLWEKKGESLRDVLKKYFQLNPPFEKGGEGGFETYHLSKVYVAVGPEGGFTEQEVMLAKDQGFISVKLGQRILRTETSAITIVGILQYELGDLS
jgi:RsmE family RNA methyltransferase